jgi:hypothetical protein
MSIVLVSIGITLALKVVLNSRQVDTPINMLGRINMIKSGELEWRWCEDIGMHVYDRPINDVGPVKGTCVHATDFCKAKCYNNKLYKVYSNMLVKDIRNEQHWSKVEPTKVKAQLDRKRKDTKRIRSCSRGEPIVTIADIFTLVSMAVEMPDRILWIPTRAWRDSMLRYMIDHNLRPLKNVAICASIDPSNSEEEWQGLIEDGWSSMFFGDDTRTTDPTGKPLFQCPKTAKGIKGHCQVCKAGCMSHATRGGVPSQVILHEH